MKTTTYHRAETLFAHDNSGVTHSVIVMGRGLTTQIFANRTEALDAAAVALNGIDANVYRAERGVFFEGDSRTVYVVETPFGADRPTVVY